MQFFTSRVQYSTASRCTLRMLVLNCSMATAALAGQPVFAQRAGAAANGDILVTARPSPRIATSACIVDKAVNVIGFEGTKENVSGRLSITEEDVVFSTDKAISRIPMSAITSVAMDHTSKPLLRGIAGTLAGLAPNGAGQLYGAIRPGAEMLTLFYTDEEDARHAALILLPKSSKATVTEALARAGLFVGESMQSNERADLRPALRPGELGRAQTTDGRPAVVVTVPASEGVAMPAAFAAGAYEQLVAQTAKSGLFGMVWRQGDRRRSAEALTMVVRITNFKKGNAGVRGAIPVVGMIAGKTLITATVSLADARGSILLEKNVKGSKRMMGESIAATKSLAQRVTGAIDEVPGFFKGPPARTLYSDRRIATR